MNNFDIMTAIAFTTMFIIFGIGVYRDARTSMKKLKEHEAEKRNKREGNVSFTEKIKEVYNQVKKESY